MTLCKVCGEREADTEWDGVPICYPCARGPNKDPMLDHDTWYENDGLEGLSVLIMIENEDDVG